MTLLSDDLITACPKCDSPSVYTRQWREGGVRTDPNVDRWRCPDCERVFGDADVVIREPAGYGAHTETILEEALSEIPDDAAEEFLEEVVADE